MPCSLSVLPWSTQLTETRRCYYYHYIPGKPCQPAGAGAGDTESTVPQSAGLRQAASDPGRKMAWESIQEAEICFLEPSAIPRPVTRNGKWESCGIFTLKGVSFDVTTYLHLRCVNFFSKWPFLGQSEVHQDHCSCVSSSASMFLRLFPMFHTSCWESDSPRLLSSPWPSCTRRGWWSRSWCRWSPSC